MMKKTYKIKPNQLVKNIDRDRIEIDETSVSTNMHSITLCQLNDQLRQIDERILELQTERETLNTRRDAVDIEIEKVKKK